MIAGSLACWWWSPRVEAPSSATTSSASTSSPEEEDVVGPAPPQLEGVAVGAPDRTGRAATRREGPPGDTGPKLIVVKCRLLDEDGKPVPKARVRVRKIDRGATYLIVSGDHELVTHSDGTFPCAMSEGEEREITVLESAAHSASYSQVIKSSAADMTFVVAREPNLTGVVLDEHGVPMHGARILVTGGKNVFDATSLGGGRPETIQFETDARGRFAARIPPRKEPVGLRIHPNKARSKELMYEDRGGVSLGSTELSIRFAKPAFIEGYMVDLAGTPVGAGRLRASPKERDIQFSGLQPDGYTDHATGRFKIGPVPPGSYELRGSVRRETAPVEPIDVEAPIQGVRVLFRAWVVAGTIVGIEDLGLHGGVIECLPMGSSDVRDERGVNLDTAGRFWVGLPRNDAYRMYFQCIGDKHWCAELEDVRPGVGLEVHLQRARRISGDYAGVSPGHSYSVEAKRNGFRVSGTIDDDGEFEVKGLTTGTWTIKVIRESDDGEFVAVAERQVEAGATNVKL